MTAVYVQEGNAIDYTPGAVVTAGQVIVQGDLVGIARLDIPADGKGSLAVDGVFDVPKATGAITTGTKVYWDEDGDPVDGTAGSGAATTVDTDNKLMGKAIAAAVSADATTRVRLSQ